MRELGRAALLGMAVLGLVGCFSKESRSPDAIRHDTAAVTAGAVRDGKAVAKGMWDGIREKGPVNINKADADKLQTLPGVTPEIAERIIDGRPYESGGDLLHRRILTKAEYNRIADKIEAR